MISQAKAFAPASISCFFRIHSDKNPRWGGSTGAGFTINEGVVVEASPSKDNKILFDEKNINFPAVESAIKRLTNKKIIIRIKSKLPLGCGFGLSGASALAAVYAVNRLLKLKKPNKELAIIAHTADAENWTGLGDVVNQYYGGFCVKLKPSSHFIVKKINLNKIGVYCRHFSKISTKSVIADIKIRDRINSAAESSLCEVQKLMKNKKNIEFGKIIRLSKEFAAKSGLLKGRKTLETINIIEKSKGNASMMMLGNAVFSDIPFEGSSKFKISDKGAHLL